MVLYYIYGIFNEDYPGTYIGHTKDLEQRLKDHKKRAKTKNFKVYKTMREIGGQWKMEVLETHECSKKYAKERERFYIELIGDLNKQTPNRTDEEYREDNKERIAECSKIWYENNKERSAETHKIWYEKNKEKRAETNKTWKKNNPEKAKEYWTKKNEKNKLNRYTCECGSNLRNADWKRHEKSKKHLAYKNAK